MFNLVNNKLQSWQWAYLLWTRRPRAPFQMFSSLLQNNDDKSTFFVLRTLTDYLVSGSLPNIFLYETWNRGSEATASAIFFQAKHAFWVKTTSMSCFLPLSAHSCGTKRRFCVNSRKQDTSETELSDRGWGLEVLETSAVDKKGDPSVCW